MGEVFWTYFLGTIGLVVLVYIVVMTPVHMVRNARARRVVDEPVERVVPDDEHVAFPEPPPPPTLTVIRGGLDLS